MRKPKRILIYSVMVFFILITASHLLAQGPLPGKPPGPPTGSPPGAPPPGFGVPPLPGKAQPAIPIEKIGPGLFRLGEIQIHKRTRSVVFPAQVNMDKGLLEYFIVRSSGKVHESVLRTAVDPYHLQIAFLLLGFEGTDRPLASQGDPQKPRGESVEIIVTSSRGKDAATAGESFNVKAEEWVAKKVGNDFVDAGTMAWVFTGSKIYEGRYMAQAEGSIVAIYHDPVAIIDNASAGGESDRIWFVKQGTVPPVGTPVTVIIRAKELRPNIGPRIPHPSAPEREGGG